MKKEYLITIGILALIIAIPLASAETQTIEVDKSLWEQFLEFLGLYEERLEPQQIQLHQSYLEDGWYLCSMDETTYTYCKGNERSLVGYGDRVNYYDENTNSWEIIDPNLENSNYQDYNYEVTKGYYKAYFKTGEDLEIDLERDDWYIKLTSVGLTEIPYGQLNSIINIMKNGQQKKWNMDQFEKKTNKLISSNVDSKYSIQFEYESSRLRETIIFNEVPDITSNKILIMLSEIDTNTNIYVDGILYGGGLVETNNEILLSSTNEDLYLVKPFAYDANNNTYEVNYVLFDVEGITYLGKYIDNNLLLNDVVYPLHIDPTTSLEEAKSIITDDNEIYQGSPDTVYNSANMRTTSYSIYNYRTYSAFDISFLDIQSINSATLYVYQSEYYYLSNYDLTITYCNDGYDQSTLTWNNQNTEVTNCDSLGSIESDYLYSGTGWKTINLTNNASYEVSDDGIWTIRFQMNPEGYSGSPYPRFAYYSKEWASAHPYLMINYTEIDFGNGTLTTNCDGKPVALHLELFDEEDQTDLYGNIRIFLNVTNDNITYNSINHTFTNVTEADICLAPANATVWTYGGIEYENYPDHVFENWFFIGAMLNNITTTVNLYDLNLTDSTSFQFTINDQNYLPVDNAYVTLQRFYPGENQYKAVEMAKSDTFGQGILHLVVEDVFYKFIISNENETLYISTPGKAYCTTLPCTLTFIVGDTLDAIYETFNDLNGITYSLDWNPDTKIITYTWNDLSGTFDNTQIEIYKGLDYIEETQVAYENSNSSSGTIFVNLTNETEGQYAVNLFVNQGSGSEELRESRGYVITIFDNFSFGNAGLFWAILVMIGVVFATIYNPKIGIIMIPASFIMLTLLKLISIPFGAVASIICLSAIVAYAVFR